MSSYRRAVVYFAPDWLRVSILFGLIGLSVSVALLEAWPLAILIDTVLSNRRGESWLNEKALLVLPESPLGQIAALVLTGLAIQTVGYAIWMARMMLTTQLNNRGTERVRSDLFRKLQRLGPDYHKTTPKGD